MCEHHAIRSVNSVSAALVEEHPRLLERLLRLERQLLCAHYGHCPVPVARHIAQIASGLLVIRKSKNNTLLAKRKLSGMVLSLQYGHFTG